MRIPFSLTKSLNQLEVLVADEDLDGEQLAVRSVDLPVTRHHSGVQQNDQALIQRRRSGCMLSRGQAIRHHQLTLICRVSPRDGGQVLRHDQGRSRPVYVTIKA